jgi:small-conductance mechanosensitive channel
MFNFFNFYSFYKNQFFLKETDIANFKNLLAENYKLILFFLIFLILIYFIFSLFLSSYLRVIKKINFSGKKISIERTLTIAKTLKLILRYILLFIFTLYILNIFGIKLTAILTGAGVLGATLILIFQNSLRDILTGWIFVFEDIFRDGEIVVVNNLFKGRVIDFKSRYLVLRSENGEILNIPYGQISNIYNLSRKRIISKVTLKLKRENFSEQLLKEIERTINEKIKEKEDLEGIKINQNFYLSENFAEIYLFFKTPYQLKDELNSKIKFILIEHYCDLILEIRDVS